MTYLLTQIIFSLLLAGVVGAAIGWLINGYRAAARLEQAFTEIQRQSQALSQAETDNKMIKDDFRELQLRSEDSIRILEENASQIPELKNNLEKSQTLVRQLLQKHEAELHQVSTENRVLSNKVRELENREKAVTRLQMDLNTERLKMRSDNKVASADAAAAVESAGTPTGTAEDDRDSIAETQSLEIQGADADSSEVAEQRVSQKIDEVRSPEQSTADSGIDEILEKAEHVLSRFEEDPNIELDFLHQELDQELDAIRNDLSSEAAPLRDVPEPDYAGLNAGFDSKRHSQANSAPGYASAQSTAAPSQGLDGRAASTDRPFHHVFGADFLPPPHTDDLQQIFGIGPVTENTLNSIDITSFEQLAMFTREHIEYVADVLQIFPGRIERDNWVGSAKKLVASRQGQSAMEESSSPHRSGSSQSLASGQLKSEIEDSLEDA